MMRRAIFSLLIVIAASGTSAAHVTQRLSIRGRDQLLRLYGPGAGMPAIVSSGDGGWIHLGPRVAEWLAARGFFVVGLDAKAYLTGFTGDTATLRIADAPADFRTLAALASSATGRKPILIGVSEGAGLSVLAATDPQTKAALISAPMCPRRRPAPTMATPCSWKNGTSDARRRASGPRSSRAARRTPRATA
ncbi:MAG: hypothetical protein DMF88_15110 [Acidobacteria bacterium]|nr:MAG: hypothetical protein DMF88_15110 [Acidobacteriota bacterium]